MADLAAASDSMSLPVGFRFHPTEQELINHYLKKKMQGLDFNNVIREIDICKFEPWDLPDFSLIYSDDDEWYYFSRPQYKNNNRIRTTNKGFWKITGREREIKPRNSRVVIGKKRTLTFYKGIVRCSEKTNWVIHEYYIPETSLPKANLRDFELIRLKKKDEGTDTAACDEGGPRTAHIFFPEETTQPEEIFAESPSDNALFYMEGFLEQYTRPEEIVASLFPQHESPPDEYFSLATRQNYVLQADPGNCIEMQSAIEDDVDCYFEGDYHLEERSNTNRHNHSSQPKSLSRVYTKGEEDALLAMTNTPRNNDRVQSITGRIMAVEVLQSGNHMPSPRVPERMSAQSMVRIETGQSTVASPTRRLKPLEVKYTSKQLPRAPEKPMVAEKPMLPPMVMNTSKQLHRAPEKPKEAEKPKLPQIVMKPKEAGTPVSDWKTSFIVWKTSPLSLKSYPPVVYTCYMIGSLILFIFFVGEVVSYGNW